MRVILQRADIQTAPALGSAVMRCPRGARCQLQGMVPRSCRSTSAKHGKVHVNTDQASPSMMKMYKMHDMHKLHTTSLHSRSRTPASRQQCYNAHADVYIA